MRVKLFAAYDIKAELFLPPFQVNTTGEAIRIFTDGVNSPDTLVGRHPGDFKLMYLGEFDTTTGELIAVQVESFGFGTDYKSKSNDVPVLHATRPA